MYTKNNAPTAGGGGGMEGTTNNNFGKRLPSPIADHLQASSRATTTPWPVPIRIDSYIDQKQFWVTTPWNERQMREFGSRYGTPIYVAKDKHGNPKPPLNVGKRVYRQCMHAYLPTWEFVEALAEFNPYPNQIEFALDLIFSSAEETRIAEEMFDQYSIKRNSGAQRVFYATNGAQNFHRHRGLVTRYVGDRRNLGRQRPGAIPADAETCSARS